MLAFLPNGIGLFFAAGDGLLRAVVLAVALLLGLALVLACAVVALHAATSRRDRRRAELEAGWEPLLLDVTAGRRPASELSARVRRRHGSAFVDLLLEYAARIRGEERQALAGLARPFLPSIVRRTNHWDASVRALAVHALGLLAPETHAGHLRAALDDRSTFVAMTAAQALARSGDASHAAAVLARLERFHRWGRTYLTSLLTTMGPAVAPPLLSTLADPERPAWIRAVAAEALRWMNVVGAAEVAAEVLEREADREVLSASLRLMRRVGRPEHAGLVRPFCASDDPVLRIHAVGALAALGDAEGPALLREAVDDPSRWVAIRAVHGLREAGRADVLRAVADSEHPRAALARQVLDEGGA